LVVSGDLFISSHEVAGQLRHDLPEALAVDMESAAVAQVCRAAALPYGIVRTISDRVDSQAGVDFAQFLSLAAPLHRDLVIEALAVLPVP
jgi:adenosylhomocysteine nucleosidase